MSNPNKTVDEQIADIIEDLLTAPNADYAHTAIKTLIRSTAKQTAKAVIGDVEDDLPTLTESTLSAPSYADDIRELLRYDQRQVLPEILN